jgi:transcriptional regulator with XRE-family HTH domain
MQRCEMGKRTYSVIVTNESKALKALRKLAGLSLRDLGAKMNFSFALVHQKEEGRSNINSEYVDKFLDATGFSNADWSTYCEERSKSKKVTNRRLKEECFKKLNNLSEAQLIALRSVLNSVQ